MLRDDIARYTELSGNDGEHTPIGIIGAFLDGYETGLKDISKREWIPVSERLPEKNTRCLVTVGLFYLTQMATYSNLMGTIDHRIFYQGDYGRENFEDITEYVKAWQPLPEPYKAESEDKE